MISERDLKEEVECLLEARRRAAVPAAAGRNLPSAAGGKFPCPSPGCIYGSCCHHLVVPCISPDLVILVKRHEAAAFLEGSLFMSRTQHPTTSRRAL